MSTDDTFTVGLLMELLTRLYGLTAEQAEAEIALGVCSENDLVQRIASDPADAVRWSAQARAHRESGGP